MTQEEYDNMQERLSKGYNLRQTIARIEKDLNTMLDARKQTAKVAMMKAILVCDLITDVAEDFADASRKMTHSSASGDTFRQMVKACSDRHEICMAEWGEVVKCIDSKGALVGKEYSEWYDKFCEDVLPVIDSFMEKMRNSKFWRKI